MTDYSLGFDDVRQTCQKPAEFCEAVVVQKALNPGACQDL
jgi:hypothetical protein